VGFSGHHLIIMTMSMTHVPRKSVYWHFNVNLLQEAGFCENCFLLGRLEKGKFFWKLETVVGCRQDSKI